MKNLPLMKIERYNHYEAEVQVKNKATLKSDFNLQDGDIIKVQAGWLIDEEDGGPYVGQYAFIPLSGYWIPQEDLIIKREISSEEYNEVKNSPL